MVKITKQKGSGGSDNNTVFLVCVYNAIVAGDVMFISLFPDVDIFIIGTSFEMVFREGGKQQQSLLLHAARRSKTTPRLLPRSIKQTGRPI